MGFALFLLERRKKYLLLYLGSGPALFWATGGKICLVYNCDTTKYPDIGDTIRMRKKKHPRKATQVAQETPNQTPLHLVIVVLVLCSIK
jgi:hypothetical protein